MNQVSTKKSVEELHAELREKARLQGVKPVEKIEDLYGNFADDVDIDEFLETVREIRNEGKNGATNE